MENAKETAEGSASRVGRLATVRKWTTCVLLGMVAFVLVLTLGFTIVPPLTERWTSRWGATDAEVDGALPGDELVASADKARTKAITIDAPADVVYPLVAQMGYKRAGWYGWDWFYKGLGAADFVEGDYSKRIVPELQGVGPGDVIYISNVVGYEVKTVDRPHAFVLYRCSGPGPALEDPEVAKAGKVWSEESWAWVVRPIDAGSCRLILRIRDAGEGQGGFEKWVYDSPLDFGGAVMGWKTMVGLKRVAESLDR